MIARKVPMYYVEDFDRWYVEVGDLKFGLHCGEGLQLHLGRRAIPCRLEYGQTWYVIAEDVKLALLRRATYLVTQNV